MNDNIVKVKKHKFNIIDMVVIILLIAIGVFLLLLADPFEWIENKSDAEIDTTINCVLEFDNISKNGKYIIHVGDISIGYLNEKQYMATVIDVKRTYGIHWVENKADNTMSLYKTKDSERVFVKMQVKCTYKPGVGYFINDELFLVGNNVRVKFPNCDGEIIGECISIELSDGGIFNAKEK